MSKGTFAKENIKKKLEECFGDDYIGEVNKKIYVWQNDGAEKVQIAIAMTCPKVPVESGAAPATSNGVAMSDGGFDWEAPAVVAQATEITVDEQENISKLMEQLGL